MVPGHSKPHSDTADIGGSNPNNGHQALSSQPPRWLSSRSRRQSNVTSVPLTTRMTTGRFARWIPSQVTDHLPALPSASSIPYFTDGMLPNWRRVATGSGNDPELAEPFEEVLPCSSSDDSTGTTVHERVDHFSDGNACELRHYRRDEDSFFLVHNAEEISADDKYDPRKWLDRPQTQTQRAARILGEGARAARQTAVRVGETAVVAGEMAMEVARVGAEVARVGAQIGGAIMVANGYNPMFDLVRDTRVWSTRSGLEFQDEAQPEIGGFDGDDSEEYESSDEEDSEDSDKDEIITDGLQLSGQERASNNDSSTDIRFFDAPEQPIASVGHIPIRHANDAFSDVELDSSGSEDRKEDFEDISIDECRAAFYALEDLGPHTRRRLQASQPVRRGLFTPNIMFGRNAPRRVPPSPSSSSVALVSERPDELPRSKRPGRHH